MKPTPETDAYIKSIRCRISYAQYICEFARNLERQRDELLEALEKIAAIDTDPDGMAWPVAIIARAAIANVKGTNK
jgi:hypothetical protein